MRKPKVIVLRAAGTNCDCETAFAFQYAGAAVEQIHVNRLINRQAQLSDYHILAIPGGFTYGDDIAAGKILANELKFKLAEDINGFIQNGKLIIGICNGFQVLVKNGLLPGNDTLEQEASLIINDSGKFEDRWVYLRTQVHKSISTQVECVWTKDLPQIIYLPVAHGEGKFVARDKTVLKKLKQNSRIIFQYCNAAGNLAGYPDNPNGSADNIAGICDTTGRILGLMPHPERHIVSQQHPKWTQVKNKKEGDGLQIFRNGVEYAKRYL